ncbi:MAG: hypothetical protein ACI4Q3_01340 [Kiritimatiellia bacterium]
MADTLSSVPTGRRGFLSGAALFGASAFLPARAAAAPSALKNGAAYALDALPDELVAQAKRGCEVRFLLEEKAADGCVWRATATAAEGAVRLEHRGAYASVTVAKRAQVQTPMLVEFAHGRAGSAPTRKMRLVVYTVPGELADCRYPENRDLAFLRAECANRGIVLTDWHVHIRGGMTVEMAAVRERACGFIRQSAMENHGREWEIFDNARLRAFARQARAVSVNGHALPVGIQVNDRDWFRQIDAETRALFDYILADTMIMGVLPNGRANRLWLVERIDDPDAWMADYVAHTLRVLGEPISILANPTYLPTPLSGLYDRLWTDARMKAVIGSAVEQGIALEIQAESSYPRPRFLKLAKRMGAKFSFGTNNFDPAPKDLARWREAIVWLDLKGDDIWRPEQLKKRV